MNKWWRDFARIAAVLPESVKLRMDAAGSEAERLTVLVAWADANESEFYDLLADQVLATVERAEAIERAKLAVTTKH